LPRLAPFHIHVPKFHTIILVTLLQEANFCVFEFVCNIQHPAPFMAITGSIYEYTDTKVLLIVDYKKVDKLLFTSILLFVIILFMRVFNN
jgi:hypothetical protein